MPAIRPNHGLAQLLCALIAVATLAALGLRGVARALIDGLAGFDELES